MPHRMGWRRWLPGLLSLRGYRAGWLARDAAAGLVLAAVLVPVGIAYAAASGLPGIYGLYATIVPLLAYAAFGPSRILVLGPDSSLAAIILGVIVAQSAGDPGRAVALAGAMALVSGLICVVAGVARISGNGAAAAAATPSAQAAATTAPIATRVPVAARRMVRCFIG